MNTISLLNNDEDIRIETNSNGEEQYIFDPFNPLNKEIKTEINPMEKEILEPIITLLKTSLPNLSVPK